MPGEIVSCATCRAQVAFNATSCPNCGEPEFIAYSDRLKCGHCGGTGDAGDSQCSRCRGRGFVHKDNPSREYWEEQARKRVAEGFRAKEESERTRPLRLAWKLIWMMPLFVIFYVGGALVVGWPLVFVLRLFWRTPHSWPPGVVTFALILVGLLIGLYGGITAALDDDL